MKQAEIVADSVAPCGTRLTTMEIELHRFILPEFNTHRMFSRNFQSSRAIPMKRQREMIQENPAFPVFWGKNQPGMVAEERLEEDALLRAEKAWEQVLLDMIYWNAELEKMGVHKQIANRLLEPFMYTKGVVTGTEKAYKHFFYLRCHKDAQPEIQSLANAMKTEWKESIPKELDMGEWHLPYVEEEHKELDLQGKINLSVSCCAQVSYRRLDKSGEKVDTVLGRLHLNQDSEDPPHPSPTEHQARVKYDWPYVGASGSGNLSGSWQQYRKVLGL